MNTKIETKSEILDKKIKDSNNQNQNIAMLKENMNFLQSELKEKNFFVKSLMENQTAALESISYANQQNHTRSSNKTSSTETRQTRNYSFTKISEAHKSAKNQSNNKLPETQKTKNNNDNNNQKGKCQNQQLQQNDAWTKVPFWNHHQRINNNNWNAKATQRNTVQDLQLSNSYQGLSFDYVDDTDFNLIPGEFLILNSMGKNQVVKPKAHRRGQVAPNQHPENQHVFPRPKHVPENYSYANAISGKTQTKNKDKIIVFGESILKGIKIAKFNQLLQNGEAKFQIFPVANSRKLLHYIDPTLEEENFKSAVIHVGTNDVNNGRDSRDGDALIENIKNIALKCISYGICKVSISSICYNTRTSNDYLQEINRKIDGICRENNFNFIDNSNITEKHLFKDGLHLLYPGKVIVANNIINRINNFLSMHLYFPYSF